MVTIKTIKELQRQYGYADMQKKIDTGIVWKLEGSYGREARQLLISGVCFLPKKFHKDYYGNLVPARQALKPGTQGTLENSQEFWGKIISGELSLW